MGPIEITVIVLVVLIVGAIVGRYIYKKINHLPTGECGCCGNHKSKNALVRKYHKKYGKKDDKKSCCCGCCNSEHSDQKDPEESCSCNK